MLRAGWTSKPRACSNGARSFAGTTMRKKRPGYRLAPPFRRRDSRMQTSSRMARDARGCGDGRLPAMATTRDASSPASMRWVAVVAAATAMRSSRRSYPSMRHVPEREDGAYYAYIAAQFDVFMSAAMRFQQVTVRGRGQFVSNRNSYFGPPSWLAVDGMLPAQILPCTSETTFFASNP